LRQTLGLFSVFGVLVGINVYVFFFSKKSIDAVKGLADQAIAAEPMDGPASRPAIPPPPLPVVHVQKPREGKIKGTESLGKSLTNAGVQTDDLDAVLHALHAVKPPLKIKAGQTWVLHMDASNRLASMELKMGPGVTYDILRASDGSFTAVKR
jgi:hypothetical protein